MKIAIAALSLVLLATVSAAVATTGDEAVDLALVLAGDVSGSMGGALGAQRSGFVAAFHDRGLAEAIRSGPLGRIAVTYVEWAGTNEQWVIVPWTIIGDSPSADAFADRLAGAPLSAGHQTSMSAGLLFAAQQFALSGVEASRRTIDVSGDGPNNAGPPIGAARQLVVAQGITINGLPLLTRPDHGPYAYMFEPPTIDLEAYFRDCVIGGPGAFTMPVSTAPRYLAAIRHKLVVEIARGAPRVMAARFVLPAASQDGSAERSAAQYACAGL